MHPLFTHTLANQHRADLQHSACEHSLHHHAGSPGFATRLWAAIAGLRPAASPAPCPSC